jgi:hypothetical protein
LQIHRRVGVGLAGHLDQAIGIVIAVRPDGAGLDADLLDEVAFVVVGVVPGSLAEQLAGGIPAWAAGFAKNRGPQNAARPTIELSKIRASAERRSPARQKGTEAKADLYGT